jgi:hypothetical protein
VEKSSSLLSETGDVLKVHAYTAIWSDRPNTRTKDLLDLVLFLTVDNPLPEEIRATVTRTFDLRATHTISAMLTSPPEEWASVYKKMAFEAGLSPADIESEFQLLRQFWSKIFG